MREPKVESFETVTKRNWLEKVYYHHGFYCASHPGLVIFICGVLILSCSAPIVIFSPLTAKIPSEWNETIPYGISGNDKPHWVKDNPAAYIQQIIVTVLVESVNVSFRVPYVAQEAFQPVFKIVKELNEYRHLGRNGKYIHLSDLCFIIRHHDPFLSSDDGKLLPRKGCLQISPVNLWKDAASFHNDIDIMAKIYGKPSKNTVSLRENIFGVPFRAVGLFPLDVKKECLAIRYAVTNVLQGYDPSFLKGLKTLLQEKFPPILKPESNRDTQNIVHIYYEGDNIIEIYHLCFTYFLVFIYLVFSVSKIEMVKSKLGLAVSAVITVVASLSMAAGLCIFFGMVPSISSSEIIPYLVIIIGLENILVITRSIVSTPAYLPVPVRVAEGLSREGRSITLNLATELLLILCGFLTFVPAVQEFCMVGGVAVLTDFFLQIVFFATVLSIDLSRLEPQSEYPKSPHVEINVCNSFSSGNMPGVGSSSQSTKKIEQPSTWQTVFDVLSTPRKLFAIRPDLPKRLNFAYFWARTRIVQRGCMAFAILYFVYVASSTLIDQGDGTLLNTSGLINYSYNATVASIETSFTKDMLPTSSTTELRDKQKQLFSTSDWDERSAHRKGNSTNYFKCKDDVNSEGLWRNLSRHHWPELLDLYGVNVMDRYISVLPPIHVNYKVNINHFGNSVSHVSDSISQFYKEFSKDAHWTSRSYAVKFELVDFVKILYIFTGIFIAVAMYLIFLLLKSRERRKKFKRSKKTVVPGTSPVFLDGHDQNIECIDCENNIIASSCLQGSLRIWDCETSECISAIPRESRSSQVWSLKCWNSFIAVGCSNGDLEIWDFSSKHLSFLYESGSPGVTAICFIIESKILVLSRLDGVLEFIELGQLHHSCSKSSVKSPNVRKKPQSNHSCWKTITNSVVKDLYPCYTCRAHRKTVSVLETCKDLVVSGSYDNLLKVFRSQSGVCLFTLRGHISPVTALNVSEPDLGAISGSSDGELRLWSLISGDCNPFSTNHLCSVVAIVCSSACIVSLDISEVLHIWDRTTRQCLHTLSQLPGGCHDLTLMSSNVAICIGRGTLVILNLPIAQILRIVELERKDDHVLMNHVLTSGPNTVVCDYGKLLVLLTFVEIIGKKE